MGSYMYIVVLHNTSGYYFVFKVGGGEGGGEGVVRVMRVK